MSNQALTGIMPDKRRFTDFANRAVDFFAVSHLRSAILLIIICVAFFLPGLASLQPMDRDEPRFAQASKQMVESGDLVDIRFQGESRYKKPVGIYWLQSASIVFTESVGIKNARNHIVFYRIPSLLGAISAILLLYWTALAFLIRRNALLAVLATSACILLGVEAHLAKTDAVLLATVMLVMGTLSRLWFHTIKPETTAAPSFANIIIFWITIGISLLVKGPITLMIALLTLFILCWRERSVKWLLILRPHIGALIVAAIVLPWLLMIISKTGMAFFSEAIGKDMLGKVATGQERHGAPPGTYFAVFWLTYWPIAPLFALAVPYIWQKRKEDDVFFLLAWIIPCWLVFELVPTKLPHYVLPLYPAFSILMMLALENKAMSVERNWARCAIVLVPLIPLIFLIGMPVAFIMLDRSFPFLAMPFLAISMLFAVLSWRELMHNTYVSGVIAAICASLALSVAAYPFGLPQLKSINLSKRLANIAQSFPCENPKIATTTYREPSLIFLTATDLLLTDAVGAAKFVAEPGCRIVFVEAKLEREFLNDENVKSGKQQIINRVKGLNINSGRMVDIGIYAKSQ